MKSLSDAAGGRYRVSTLSGAKYLLDLDARSFERVARSPVNQSRTNSLAGPLLALVSCEIGERMQLLIDFNLTRFTLTTTPVLTIKPLGADDVSKVPEQ